MDTDSILNDAEGKDIGQSEKMVPASRVSELVQESKLKGIEKAKRELSEKYDEEIRQLKASMPQSMGGIPQPSEDELYDKFEQRLMKKAQEQQEAAHQAELERESASASQSYMAKMAMGKDVADDFDAITSPFDVNEFPHLAYLASKLDNTPAVIYELMQNPTKLASIDYLARTSPKMAQSQLETLSRSIIENQKAKMENPKTAAPLSSMKPSSVAGADGGKMGISDYKRAPWLKA